MQVEIFVEMFEMEIVHKMGRSGTRLVCIVASMVATLASQTVALSGIGRVWYEKM